MKIKIILLFLGIITSIVLYFSSCTWFWKNKKSNGFINDPLTIEWNTDKDSFTILQIADSQIGDMYFDKCRNIDYKNNYGICNAYNTTNLIEQLIIKEEPDLVIFTGDQMIGSIFSNPKKILKQTLGPVIDRNIPYVFIYGNHDVEQCIRWTYKQIYDYVSQKNAILIGTGLITIVKNTSKIANLWFFDHIFGSNDYDQQIMWYHDQDTANITGIAFRHIPLPEYNYVGSNAMIGNVQEDIGTFAHDDIFFDNFLEINNIKMINVGHDHNNDFCAPYHGIELCYGGSVGYTTYGKDNWSRRARIIKIFPNSTIFTYKRLDNFYTIDKQYI